MVGKVCVPDIRKRIHFVTNFFRISLQPAEFLTCSYFARNEQLPFDWAKAIGIRIFRWQKNA